MKLITKEIEKKLPALYGQDGKGMAAICYLKLFDAFGQSFWFITEYDPKEKIAFGWACLGGDTDNAEFGYVSIQELEEIKINGKPRIERDKYFKPFYKTYRNLSFLFASCFSETTCLSSEDDKYWLFSPQALIPVELTVLYILTLNFMLGFYKNQ